uniref:Uncharacterized protein n=1 Tax=Timema poppense TaxID=170557 RepID=A0A7R9H836_TIMPO|nr:unnamed protein product [Timema poppensis]
MSLVLVRTMTQYLESSLKSGPGLAQAILCPYSEDMSTTWRCAHRRSRQLFSRQASCSASALPVLWPCSEDISTTWSFFSLDNSFSCQASSLEFLSRHNFDFNKFVYEGLPYLSQSQESQLRQELCEGHLFQDLERTVTLDDERVLQEECSRVCDWVASAVLGDSILLGGENLQHRGKSLNYILHKELRKRFLSVWTFPEKGLVLVKKVSADERNDFVDLERESSSLEHDVIKSMLGFSRVFKLLTELGKPLVGHNLLLDLALMYAQFHEPLPCMCISDKRNAEWYLVADNAGGRISGVTEHLSAITFTVGILWCRWNKINCGTDTCAYSELVNIAIKNHKAMAIFSKRKIGIGSSNIVIGCFITPLDMVKKGASIKYTMARATRVLVLQS